VAKLAHRLARIYAPDKEMLRKADADEAWAVFATTDQEAVPIYFSMNTGGYYR
jgi:Trk K+ transport system NAD-binding subunit